MQLRGTFRVSLTASLDAAGIDDRDQAAVRLAYEYAEELDDGCADLPKVGAQYLAALGALNLTPKSRAAATGGHRDDAAPRNPLDELRARRGARESGTA